MRHRNRSETILYVIDEQALARQDLEQSFSDQGQEQQRPDAGVGSVTSSK